MLEQLAAVGAPSAMQRSLRDDGQLRVLSDHEEAIARRHAEQETERAKVAVRDVHVLRLDPGEHGLQQTAFLRVAVLASDHLRSQSRLRLQHDERLARQRPRRAIPKHIKTTLGGGQMVAVEHLDPVAAQPGRPRRSKLFDHRPQPLGRVGDQRPAGRDLHAIELAVQGRKRDRQLLAHGLVRLAHRTMHAAHDQRHQLHQRREQQALLVLPLGALAKQRVQRLRLQSALHQGARHDGDRAAFGELLEHLR